MENKGLLFIPDISGFTRFVNGMEIGHSKLIIQELLEILINSNEIGLEVSEIEGDAILFYKFGEPPEIGTIYSQVEKMFCEFHKNLLSYVHRRYCQCNACVSAGALSLKIVTHYGEFTSYNVKNFKKLIGRDVIVAHQLLKNDIDKHEYWLVTNNLLEDSTQSNFAEWMKWNSSKKITEDGEIRFHYTLLSDLKENIKPEPFPLPDLSNSVKVLSISNEYNTDIITLFHATGDFNYRSHWMEGVKKVEEVDHYLPRVGMKCCCIMKTGETMIYSSSYSFSPEKIQFSETDDKNNSTVFYTLEKTGNSTTRLTVDIYIQKSKFSQTFFNLIKRNKIEELYHKSLKNLHEVVKQINLTEV